MNIIEKTAYVCQVCGKWFSDKTYAEKCCTSKKCEVCGKILPCNYYYTCCDSCREQKKFEKAQKISLKEYSEGSILVEGIVWHGGTEDTFLGNGVSLLEKGAKISNMKIVSFGLCE